jgi:hypothetical protein
MALQVSEIIGPLMAAVIFNAFLFGICVTQSVTYATSRFKDPVTIRHDFDQLIYDISRMDDNEFLNT